MNSFSSAQDAEERYKRLEFLLQKSSTYATILHKQMDMAKTRSKIASSSNVKPKPARGGRRSRGGGQKRRKVASRADIQEVDEDNPNATEDEGSFQQPALVTGGKLKEYQLEGVAWMCSLWENGISGILGMPFIELLQVRFN